MNSHYRIPSELIYEEHLKIISDIKFTRREVDIIACILSGRPVKSISSLLLVSPRTIETHRYNIMSKLDCSSREGIINFVEKSGKLSLFQSYYMSLLTENSFKKGLETLSIQLNRQNLSCTIIHWLEESSDQALIYQLEKDLTSVGIIFSQQLLTYFLEKIIPENNDYLKGPGSKEAFFIYIGPKTLLSQIQIELERKKITLKNPLIMIDLQQNDSGEEKKEEYFIKISGKNYYDIFLKILKIIVPDVNIEEVFSESIRKKEEEQKKVKNYLQPPLNPVEIKDASLSQKILEFSKHKKSWIVIAFIIFIVSFPIIFLSEKYNKTNVSTRSDLCIPTENILLKRSDMIKKIEKKLRERQDINIVALVGIGGAGKTTLAREFGLLQHASVVWEINAKTKESLVKSFIGLAYALANTSSQKSELDFILKIQDQNEKEKQLLFLVKKWLKEQSKWLLIYDNVENLSEIKNYFPQDVSVWGKGTLIITTRDSGIKNINYINPEYIIEISELSKEEALLLFSKILYNLDLHKLSEDQKESASKFLENIPPFPLDVSVAAYYIKNAQITYDQYLKRIDQYSQNFEGEQKRLLMETSDYTKTRHGIIKSSLEKLVNDSADFKGFLFLISLLDSQNIPKALLELWKGSILSDKFLMALKKYSLITNETGNTTQISFSLHRSTQEICFSFLLKILTEEEQTILIKNILSTIKKYEKNCNQRILLISHLNSCYEKLKEVKIQKNKKDQYEADIQYLLAYAHLKCTQHFLLARKSFIKFLEKTNDGLSLSRITHATVLKDLADISTITNDANDAKESIDYATKSLEISKKLPNPGSLIVENLQILGTAYRKINNFEKSKEYFNQALKEVSKLPNATRREIEAEIYTRFGLLHLFTYLHKKESLIAEEYGLKALKTLNGEKLFSKDHNLDLKKASCDIARHRWKLGQVYSVRGQYKKAEEELKEALYIVNHNCSQDLYLKVRLLGTLGEILLRLGKTSEAEKSLTENIASGEGLLGRSALWLEIIFRSEARLRLGRLKEAYDDCLLALELKLEEKDSSNYTNLMYAVCSYNAAVIKYKQDDLKKSAEHFSVFFKEIKEFCKEFLEKRKYKDLESKGVFASVDLSKIPSKTDMKQYLNRSTQIFSIIYGPDHPFVRDYVMKN